MKGSHSGNEYLFGGGGTREEIEGEEGESEKSENIFHERWGEGDLNSSEWEWEVCHLLNECFW